MDPFRTEGNLKFVIACCLVRDSDPFHSGSSSRVQKLATIVENESPSNTSGLARAQTHHFRILRKPRGRVAISHHNMQLRNRLLHPHGMMERGFAVIRKALKHGGRSDTLIPSFASNVVSAFSGPLGRVA